MCRVAVAEFEAAPSSPAGARRWVDERLRRWEVEELVETSTLLASELVANVVRHTSSRPSVTMSVAGGILELGVTDQEPSRPRSAQVAEPVGPATVMAENGRGLLLVQAFADEWGATDLLVGKYVWFRLAVGEWPYASACRCHRPDPDRVLLGSGRHALHTLAGGPDITLSRP